MIVIDDAAHAPELVAALAAGSIHCAEIALRPFAGLGFVPSGGVSAANTAEYLAHEAVPAVSGSWMATRAHIQNGQFDEIAALSRATLVAVGAA